MLHLAALPGDAPFEEQLAPINILGAYNAFEAACEAGVRRVVFASSVQTVECYPRDRTVQISDPVRPTSLYAATKCFGEAMGRYCHHRHGLEVVSLRLGGFLPADRPPERRDPDLWLSDRDAVQLFLCAIEREDVGCVEVFGTSITRNPWMSLREAREKLGYEPRDRVAGA